MSRGSRGRAHPGTNLSGQRKVSDLCLDDSDDEGVFHLRRKAKKVEPLHKEEDSVLAKHIFDIKAEQNLDDCELINALASDNHIEDAKKAAAKREEVVAEQAAEAARKKEADKKERLMAKKEKELETIDEAAVRMLAEADEALEVYLKSVNK